VIALGRDGKRAWSINLGSEVTGLPLLTDQTVWLLTRDGSLHVRARSDGANREKMSLGVLPASGLFLAGTQPVVAAARGTIRPMTARPRAASNP
jgi:hypothetical protein